MSATLVPRIVVAGTSSGAGKTTVACGLIGALRARGLTVQGFKVGPDYIDPSHHALASGRPGRNLDAFLAGPDLIAPLARHGGTGADVAVVEGVMGMFDGATGRGELASTAHVAKLLDAPVVLVLDASAMARSAAAVVHGFRDFDPAVRVAGVILNRVGSDGHEQLLREALADGGVPVLGALRRDERIATPERHLGLVPVAEREAQARDALALLADATARHVDLDATLALARSAPPAPGPAWAPDDGLPDRPPDRRGQGDHRDDGDRPHGDPVGVAIAAGPAFSFHYTENLERLEAAGARLLPFDPLVDESLPDGTDALLLAGGFPELFAAELAANAPLREQVRAHASAGRPTIAECGGLLYLGERFDEHEMCGALPLRGAMGRMTLGYREATVATAVPWQPAGEVVRGHEFHYSQVEPTAATSPAWRLASRGVDRPDGVASGAVQAGYLHVHWAAYPDVPARFVDAARDRRSGRAGA
ncbi:MAG: cobyrinate a,c-diamide synthase [Solirubrobacteraceae bacterium]|nr:cobyrinate a,c-diamide synthase [Solirubrobacteraceae bacterium]